MTDSLPPDSLLPNSLPQDPMPGKSAPRDPALQNPSAESSSPKNSSPKSDSSENSSSKNSAPPKDPLHGITLEKLLTELVSHFSWEALAKQVNINCFKSDPSIKSSLKFLRRTPWARKEVETLYLDFVEGYLRPDMSRVSKRRSATATHKGNETNVNKVKVSQAKPAADSPWNDHPLVNKKV